MSCWTKEQLEDMLYDVVDQLGLSEYAIDKHGPLGTEPSKLVKLVLEEKSLIIKVLSNRAEKAERRVEKLEKIIEKFSQASQGCYHHILKDKT
jgi:hypothetical protein